MPLKHQLIGDINVLTSWIYYGCEVPVTVFAEAALPFAGETALALLGFGWQDIVSDFWRPAGLRCGRHGKKRNRRKKLPGIPDIPDLVAEHMPTTREFLKPLHTANTRTIFQIYDIDQRVAYQTMLVELSADFAINSVLAVMKSEQTHCDVAGRVFRKGNDPFVFNNNAWYPIKQPDLEYEEYPCGSSNYNIYGYDHKRYQILASTRCHNRGDTEGHCEVMLDVPFGSVTGSIYEDLGPIPAGSGKSMVWDLRVNGPFQATLYQKTTGDIGFFDSTLQAFPSAF